MSDASRTVLRDVRCPSKRSLTAAALCILMAGNGAPPVAWAKPPFPPRTNLGTARRIHAMPATVTTRVRALLAPKPPALADPGISVADAVRFLEQATFGPSFAADPTDPVSVAHVQQVGFEAWLTEQFNPSLIQFTNYPPPGDPGTCDDVPGAAGGICWSAVNPAGTCTNTGSTCNRDNYTAWVLQNQFFSDALTLPDQLRQKVAWALTQIDVVSEVDIGIRPASWMVPYLQLFDFDSLGNYRQLMYDLTVNPAMGEYLNMRGNRKTNVNENYAREILQLFTIGLNELNDDGTLQTDGNGNSIPTYNQDIITAFARVFTGWDLDTQVAPGFPNYRDPMVVVNGGIYHDTDPKTILDNLTVNDDTALELNEALDNIFNHRGPNGQGGIGPFIGRQLIQKLVTSNPSPVYVQRVTNAFNSGSYTGPGGTQFGSGTRGDMQAVVAAILLDDEARTAPTNATYGHLREPVLFITNTLRALGIVDPFGVYTTDFVLGDQFLPSGTSNVRMDQDVFRPPTVFSYYPPDNQLPGGSGLFAPEMAIQSTSTALAHVNIVYDFAYGKLRVDSSHPLGTTWIDTTQYEPQAAGDATALLDGSPDGSFLGLNTILMHGAMSQSLHDFVLSKVTAIPGTDLTGRVREAIYLITSSAEYQVER